ncbi:MAG: hypothetical protein IKT17_05220 [Lachnospiraceae bacterium]|nr:hypothetical protein [Lachnospiraceae bacterium]
MAGNEILKEGELDSVSGGMLFDSTGTNEYVANFPWEVLDNNSCKILGKFPTQEAAAEYAKAIGDGTSYDAEVVDLATVQRLRNSPNVPQ